MIELLVAVAMAGILLLIAYPGWGALRDRIAVNRAVDLLLAAHARARLVAASERRASLLALTVDSLVLRVAESEGDTVERWRASGPREDGVSVTGMPKLVRFAPSGVTLGAANATYELSRGVARKQVVVSRYGRIRVN